MNIFMLLYVKYPDIRVEKEVKSLLEAGHTVSILAANNGKDQIVERIGGLTLFRPLEFSYNYMWTGFHYFWGAINFVDRWVMRQCEKILSTDEFDVIHVHDLRLVKVGVLLGKKYNLKVIADLHENYPAAIKAYTEDSSWRSFIRKHTVDRYSRWVEYERQILPKVDSVIAVVDEAKERIIRDCGIDGDKIFVVSNTESFDGFAKMPVDDNVADKYAGRFVLSYIGGVDYHRGVDTVIKAMPEILKKIPNAIFLVIGGDGGACEVEMKCLADACGVSEQVKFLGRIPFSAVPSYVAASTVGVIAQYASEHANYTVPHKIFQYLIMGKPVIVSDCYPLKRIVEEGRCGIVFKSGDFRSFANNLKPDTDYERLGNNGLKIVEERYNWNIDEKVLLDLYSSFA